MSVDPSRLCQIEIQVSNLERSLRFYGEAFGWHRLPADMHEYTVLSVPRDCPFGISLIVNPALANQSTDLQRDQIGQLVLYFKVADPEEVVRRVIDAGGHKRFGPRKLGGYGEVYQVTDPDGQRYGLYRGSS